MRTLLGQRARVRQRLVVAARGPRDASRLHRRPASAPAARTYYAGSDFSPMTMQVFTEGRDGSVRWERPPEGSETDGAGVDRQQHGRPPGRKETPMAMGSRLGLLLVATTLGVLGGSPAWAAPKPPLCTTGRYAVAGSPLLGPGGEVVVLENGTIAIGSRCAARATQLTR